MNELFPSLSRPRHHSPLRLPGLGVLGLTFGLAAAAAGPEFLRPAILFPGMKPDAQFTPATDPAAAAPPEPAPRPRRRRATRAQKEAAAETEAEPPTPRPPQCNSFAEFLRDHARVLRRDGTGGDFSTEGRTPLRLVIGWMDQILRNTLDREAVTIDGVSFAPGELAGTTLAVGGGAQWGKTLLELNLMAYATAVRFASVGCYLPDAEKVEEIVGQKFRPNVLDLYPWMAAMIQLGKTENASGKTVNRKQSYQVADGERKSFGNFCGMHKPPTSITLDLAILDEVDDIPDRNIGYVSGRMTSSPVRLTCFIGTQRVAGAGQNARLKASSFHVAVYDCPQCGRRQNLEEEFPRCVRLDGRPITPESGFDRAGRYHVACVDCGAELDRDAHTYVARNPERIAQARLGVRVSQLNVSAIPLREIVGEWYAAFEDPAGEALVAFGCDRLAIPNAGATQPLTPTVLAEARRLGRAPAESAAEPYAMSLARGHAPRFAGLDMGPRCWLWVDEVTDPAVSACVWAELIASGNATVRLPLLMDALGIQCVFLDAGGEPDLTKRLVLALNGLDDYVPPALPRAELIRAHLTHPATGLAWDGPRGCWHGLRAAAVLFTAGEAKGVEQTIGWTQDGKLYPLIKCHRAESIQMAVNDFLTPTGGVIELLSDHAGTKRIRTLPRARLPETCLGAGVSAAVLESHLLNLRKERDSRTGAEDWIDGVENHLGLAKVYARLAGMVTGLSGRTQPFAYERASGERNDPEPRRPLC
jgi:hypothetical protein